MRYSQARPTEKSAGSPDKTGSGGPALYATDTEQDEVSRSPHGTPRPLADTYGSIENIVMKLRTLRIASLEYRQRRDAPAKLPSRKALAGIVEGLCAALFPNRLGPPQLDDEGIDYYVGHVLDVTLRELLTQVSRELRFASGREASGEAEMERAATIVRSFTHQLPHIRELLDSDIHAAFEGDPAARTKYLSAIPA